MLGTDVDPVALTAALRNAEANGVGASFQVRHAVLASCSCNSCSAWVLLAVLSYHLNACTGFGHGLIQGMLQLPCVQLSDVDLEQGMTCAGGRGGPCTCSLTSASAPRPLHCQHPEGSLAQQQVLCNAATHPLVVTYALRSWFCDEQAKMTMPHPDVFRAAPHLL